MSRPCECLSPNQQCRRAGAPMVGRLWELCSGTNCDAGLSSKYRDLWDSQDKVALYAETSAANEIQNDIADPLGFALVVPPLPSSGPGTELKALLALVGITATPNCSCNARAAEMDRQGCDWCEENIDTIVDWLREEAESRGLPFLDAAGRLLVRRAIHNARRAAS